MVVIYNEVMISVIMLVTSVLCWLLGQAPVLTQKSPGSSGLKTDSSQACVSAWCLGSG